MITQTQTKISGFAAGAGRRLWRWIDGNALADHTNPAAERHIDWLRTLPFILLHLACLAVFWVGWSTTAIVVALALYAVRMLAITGFYHRYFSHRCFKTSRLVQFIFALLGATAIQRGPLWWASHHRHHHSHSDNETDSHSPRQHGFFWSHMGWFLARENFLPRKERVKDLWQYPELRFLDRFDGLIPVLLALTLYLIGEALAHYAPGLQTNGWQLLVWGFVISTVVLYHATFTINSLAHRFGTRRFGTRDSSRNNILLALITFGEGWHNNHHFFPGSARQGFRWWEIDTTYYFLRLLSGLGLIWDLKPAPTRDFQHKNSLAYKTVSERERV